MALRYIREIGDPILYKKAKQVEKIDKHILMILEDMAETMYNADGVGLAANQIGILRRLVVVIDIS
ncbi:MAG: peptide deformylase [Thermoanaerobacterium sp.]|nr:peptide deformylase [Thermoanaerobacterium sp.]